eukprot:COSAG02_NODE_10706_length_1878_cov_1.251265_3_plen_32_part_01
MLQVNRYFDSHTYKLPPRNKVCLQTTVEEQRK